MNWHGIRSISRILRLIIFPLYHTFIVETGFSLQETMHKLSAVIDSKFIPHEQTKIKYEGYLNENGFKIREKTIVHAASAVVIYGKFNANKNGISIHVKMRLAYVLYGIVFVFVGVFLKGFIIRLVNSSENWLEALLMAIFAWMGFVIYYWYNVRSFKRVLSNLFAKPQE